MAEPELNRLLDRPFGLLDAYVEARRRGLDPYVVCEDLIVRGTYSRSLDKLERRLAELDRIDGLFHAAAARNGRTPCAPESPLPLRASRHAKSGVQLRHPATVTAKEHAARREYARAHVARLSAHLHV